MSGVSHLRGLALGLWLSLALVLGPLLVLGQQAQAEVRLTLGEARGSAVRLLQAGNPEAALILAQGVLLGAPKDVHAMLLTSRAYLDLGRPVAAQGAARAALDVAQSDQEHYYSAMVMAQAQGLLGHPMRAQFWLRQAAEVAPNQNQRAAAVADFRTVRRTNPSRVRLAFAISPSDNLNAAPKTNVMMFGGLPFVNPSAVPLSGLRSQMNAEYLHRFALGGDSRLNLRATYQRERVQFSQEARALVPGVRNADYATDILGLSAALERRGAAGRWLGSAELAGLRIWAGGAHLSDVVQGKLSYGRAVAEGVVLDGRLLLERETRQDTSLRNSTTKEWMLGVEKRFDHGVLRFELAGADVASDGRAVGRFSREAMLRYRLSQPVKGMLPSVSLHYEQSVFDQAPAAFWTDARRDAEWRVSVDVLLPALDYYGFAPEIGVSFRDRQSNYDLYETQGSQLHFGVKSVF